MKETELADLSVVLRSFGFISPQVLANLLSDRRVLISSSKEAFADLDLQCIQEDCKSLYYRKVRKFAFWTAKKPVYHSLLPHVTFSGDRVKPLWANEEGRALVAWYEGGSSRKFLVGMNVVEEIVRHRQGNPGAAGNVKLSHCNGISFEQPYYLFEEQLHTQYRTEPWVDNIGYLLAETLAMMSGTAIIDCLRRGAKGAIVLTGDDDQAFLEKYEEQLGIVKDSPISYFLVPQTKHTKETLAKFPVSVELGLHVDALEHPEDYDRLCEQQTRMLRGLTDRPLRAVRNHGFLNRGYLGHLKAWEENDIVMAVNYPGWDGVALNASFLPMRIRRRDGTWSPVYSLLTFFGDGIFYAFNLSFGKIRKKIRKAAHKIESSRPGAIVFNFHPQNVGDTRKLHREVLSISRRKGWIALGIESYVDWIKKTEAVTFELTEEGRRILRSPVPIENLSLRFMSNGRWHAKTMTVQPGETFLSIPIQKV